MTTRTWTVIVVDTDGASPPVRFFKTYSNFDSLVAETLAHLEEREFKFPDNNPGNAHEMAAFRKNLGELCNGGFVCSISNTICVDVRVTEVEHKVKTGPAKIYLADAIEIPTTKRARQD